MKITYRTAFFVAVGITVLVSVFPLPWGQSGFEESLSAEELAHITDVMEELQELGGRELLEMRNGQLLTIIHLNSGPTLEVISVLEGSPRTIFLDRPSPFINDVLRVVRQADLDYEESILKFFQQQPSDWGFSYSEWGF
jgi:hypothetical protein